MAQPIVATEGTWSDILHGNGPILVDFWAPWCGWCQRLAPAFQRLAAEYEGRVRFATVNVDEEPDLAARYGVQGIPALKLFCDGQLVDEIGGYLPEADLRRRLEEAIVADGVCAIAQ